MEQLQVFDFHNQELRTMNNGSGVWFNLNDVCEVLELNNPRQVKTRLKTDGVISNDIIDNLGRTQSATFINEPNLYKVIFQSRKEEAEQFQDWVYEEVLPQIRQSGRYSKPKSSTEIMRLHYEALEETNDRVDVVESKVDRLENQLKLETSEYNYIARILNRSVMTTIKQFGYSNSPEIKSEFYRDINYGLNSLCGVKTRTHIKQKDFNKAVDFLTSWVPSTAARMKAQQLSLDLDKEKENA